GFYFYNGSAWLPLASVNSGLEKITEGSNSGWRFIGVNPANYGDIGLNAVDLSYSGSATAQFGATGNYSTAMGRNTEASGFFSTAMGYYTEASGWASTAMGAYTQASGSFSTAMGYNTEASGDYSAAMGRNTTASGDYAISAGESSIASGSHSVSYGFSSDATGNYSTVIGGYNSQATNTYALASGVFSMATGIAAIALGNNATASGDNSLAIGKNTTAYSSSEITLGIFNSSYTPSSATSWVGTDRLFVLGNGVSSAALSNALIIYKDGRMNINDAYTMPIVDGGANQVLTTDGSGNVSWAAASTGTDDQNISGSGLTGTTLTIGIEGGGNETVDLSPMLRGAENGLNLNGNAIRMGGMLLENTTINQGNFGMTYNLSGTGDFSIQDNGVGTFSVVDNGKTYLGGDAYFRSGSTIGTDLALLSDDGNDGRFRMYENGIVSMDLDMNTHFLFNAQGLDRDFRVESATDANAFRLDAANNRIGIGTATPSADLHVFRPDTDIARIYATGTIQGSGMFYAGQGPSYGGGFVYDGDGTPALVGGSDRITFFRRDNNTDTDVMSYGHNSSVVRITNLAGTGNRIVVADPNGDLSTQAIPTSTDDQNISGSGLSGTTLTIGIEGGGSETVDLSSLQDDGDWTLSGNDMYNANSGHVGVGSTSPNISGVTKALTVSASEFYSGNKVAALELQGSTISANGLLGQISFFHAISNNDASRIESRAATGVLSHGQLAFLTNNGSLSERMRITHDGNVGIGTSTPGDLLEVRNTIGKSRVKIRGDAGSTSTRAELVLDRTAEARGAGVRIEASSSQLDDWYVGVPYANGSSSSGFSIGANGSQPEYISNSKFYIDLGGNVGIGVTTPTTPLSIMGNGGAKPVGITQNKVGGTATMELTTEDGSGNQATRLKFGGNGNTPDVVFYSGASGSESATVHIEGTNGNVGIGTTNPFNKLHVEGGGSTAVRINSSGATNNYSLIAHNSGGSAAKFQTGGTIGGYTANTAINAKAYGSGAYGIFASSDDGVGVLAQSQGSSPALDAWAFGSGLAGYFRGGDVHIEEKLGIGDATPDGKLEVRQTGTADIFNLYDNTTNVFTVRDGGNVGIGTSSPATKLDVYPNTDKSAQIGRAHVGYIGHSDYAGFAHVDQDAASNYALLQSSTGQTYLNAASGQPINFRIANSTKMYLKSDGKVGIGTTAPLSDLHIDQSGGNGTAQGTGGLNLEGTSGSHWRMYNSNQYIRFNLSTNGGSTYTPLAYVHWVDGSWNQLSDASLKTDVEPMGLVIS
ncbi:hypothetical protein OAK19_06000, partial [Aureispira]|nr:hypothetical protein [Aureispira sp.]